MELQLASARPQRAPGKEGLRASESIRFQRTYAGRRIHMYVHIFGTYPVTFG